jgi:hypothetical protein
MNDYPFGPSSGLLPSGLSLLFLRLPPESGCKDKPFFIIPATFPYPFLSFNLLKLPIPLREKVLYNMFFTENRKNIC